MQPQQQLQQQEQQQQEQEQQQQVTNQHGAHAYAQSSETLKAHANVLKVCPATCI